MQRFQLFLIIASCIVISSCSDDKLMDDGEVCVEEITFRDDIRNILATSCAYSGCHDGSSAPGNYNNYDDMRPFLNDNKFKRRVMERRDMPPSYATGPTSLSESELQLISCWIEGGYLEN